MRNETEEHLPINEDFNTLLQTQYRVYDGLLAAGLCLCFLVGFPGNCLSLIYFIRTKKRNLPTLLYITACLIDIVSCVIHLPVTVNLFNKRSAGLLGNKVFCIIWGFLFTAAQLMSMFVVMIISLTRAIVIVIPFYKVRKRTVFFAIVLAFFCVVIGNVAIFFNGEYNYFITHSFCSYYTSGLMQYVYIAMYSLWTGITPLIVFAATLVATVKLRGRARNRLQLTESQKNRRKASTTVIYFAVVFLVCNFLSFLNIVLLTSAEISGKPSMYFHQNPFMLYYSITLSYIFCTVLNATLNPILYVFRFKEMRKWLTNARATNETEDNRT